MALHSQYEEHSLQRMAQHADLMAFRLNSRLKVAVAVARISHRRHFRR